jgi:hypothetical protein
VQHREGAAGTGGQHSGNRGVSAQPQNDIGLEFPDDPERPEQSRRKPGQGPHRPAETAPFDAPERHDPQGISGPGQGRSFQGAAGADEQHAGIGNPIPEGVGRGDARKQMPARDAAGHQKSDGSIHDLHPWGPYPWVEAASTFIRKPTETRLTTREVPP